MRVLLGGYLLVLFAISVIDCGPKRTHADADLDNTFISPNKVTYNIIDVLLEKRPKCVKGVEKAEDAKKAKPDEASSSRVTQSAATAEGLKSPYILKIDYGKFTDNEVNFLLALGKKEGFPELIEHGELPHEQNSAVLKYFIITRFGPDMLKHFNENRSAFTQHFIRDIAVDAIHHLQVMHEAGFAHRDVKPENMCLTQQPGATHRISFIDFGFAGRLVNTEHGSFVQENKTLGTLEYMSRAAHDAEPLSAQSDIESLALAILFFIEGGLPWNRVDFDNDGMAVFKDDFWNERNDIIDFLSDDAVPFLDFFQAVKELVPGVPVNYEHLRQVLKGLQLITAARRTK